MHDFQVFSDLFCTFKLKPRMLCFWVKTILPERPAQESGLCKVFLKSSLQMLEFARTYARTMQQGLGFRLVLWKGDLNMQHFPGISCRDDLEMLIYQGCSARMIQRLVFFFAGAILHAKFSKKKGAPKMQLQNLALQSHEAAGLSQGSPLSIVFMCHKIHRYEPCC